jgi:histone acetyltransferase (RNA polymerase elongator complex component)
LRTIPDYETLQQRVTDLMRQTMGRDPEDWEVSILADEMKAQHETYNEQMIQAARDAYDGKGRVEDIEVPDPVVRTQRYLEERYAPEIGRLEDIDEAAQSNQLMINAITKGAQMVGGR